MKIQFSVLFCVLVVGNIAKAVDLGNCVEEVKGTLWDSGLVVRGGKVAVAKDDNILTKETGENRDKFKYKGAAPFGASDSQINHFEITKDAKGNYVYTIVDDPEDRKRVNDLLKAEGNFEEFPDVQGEEFVFSQDKGKCVMSQNSMLVKYGKDTKPVKEVVDDKTYCDSIKSLLAGAGKDDVKKCTSIMTEAATKFQNRALELAKEGKSFVDQPGTGRGTEGFQSAIKKVANCSPEEWEMRKELRHYAAHLKEMRKEINAELRDKRRSESAPAVR